MAKKKDGKDGGGKPPKEPKKTKKVLSEEELKELKAKGVVRSAEQSRLALKKKEKMFYDLQRMRLQVSGRLQPKAKGADIQLTEYDRAVLETRAKNLHEAEKAALLDIVDHLRDIPFYVNTLSDKKRYKGIGPTMAGVILSEFDIKRQDTVSEMWSFAGLAPVAATRCKKCNRIVEPAKGNGVWQHAKGAWWQKGKTKKCPYEDGAVPPEQTYASGRAMRPARGVKLPFNAFLRSKLVGVLGPILLKCNSPWRVYYDNYKQYWTNLGRGVNDAHRHQAAIRYMVKQLLGDVWEQWRKAEGLPVRPWYSDEKLGKRHSKIMEEENLNQRRPEPEEEVNPEVEAELAQLEEMGLIEKEPRAQP